MLWAYCAILAWVVCGFAFWAFMMFQFEQDDHRDVTWFDVLIVLPCCLIGGAIPAVGVAFGLLSQASFWSKPVFKRRGRNAD